MPLAKLTARRGNGSPSGQGAAIPHSGLPVDHSEPDCEAVAEIRATFKRPVERDDHPKGVAGVAHSQEHAVNPGRRQRRNHQEGTAGSRPCRANVRPSREDEHPQELRHVRQLEEQTTERLRMSAQRGTKATGQRTRSRQRQRLSLPRGQLAGMAFTRGTYKAGGK